MDRLETELTHMLQLLAPPYFNGWKAEVERKAKHLEATDPEMAGLWNRVRAEVKARGWNKPEESSAFTWPDR